MKYTPASNTPSKTIYEVVLADGTINMTTTDAVTAYIDAEMNHIGAFVRETNVDAMKDIKTDDIVA